MGEGFEHTQIHKPIHIHTYAHGAMKRQLGPTAWTVDARILCPTKLSYQKLI